MPSILIADDHAIVRKGLKEALQEEVPDVSFGEAQNGQEVLKLVWKQSWDLVVLDITMEGRSGLEILEELRKIRPKLPVLIVSMYPESDFAVRTLKLGAAGYVCKQSAAEELVNAVKKILAGGRYISLAMAEQLAAELQRAPGQELPHQTLSTRELEVLRLIAVGKSLKEIADELCLSIKTVGTYHIRILQKMRMKSDVELTRYALFHKLVQ